jgi:Arc/MetJ-type ribon-helix-helix transcriptional regulator
MIWALHLTLECIVFKIRQMGKDRVTLKIPRPLYEKIKTVIEGSGFSSVNEFVVYILRDLISQSKDKKELSAEEVEAIRQRLKNLGYF